MFGHSVTLSNGNRVTNTGKDPCSVTVLLSVAQETGQQTRQLDGAGPRLHRGQITYLKPTRLRIWSGIQHAVVDDDDDLDPKIPRTVFCGGASLDLFNFSDRMLEPWGLVIHTLPRSCSKSLAYRHQGG